MRVFYKTLCSILLLSGIILGSGKLVLASEMVSYPILPNFSHVEEDRDDFHTSTIQNDEEAFIFVKHRMINRRAEINLKLSKELTEDIHKRFLVGNPEEEYAKYLISKVEKHTGVPTEGDYLKSAYNYVTILSELEDGCSIIKIRLNFYVNTDKEKIVDNKIKELLSENGALGYINHNHIGDFEKIRGIFRWMTENMVYDYSDRCRSAYHGLIEGKTVCQGFSAIFYRLCLELGIDCRIITGDIDGEQHAWNIVKLGNEYYNIDTTVSLGKKEDDKAYCILLGNDPNGLFLKTQKRTPGIEFKSASFQSLYPMSKEDYNFILNNVAEPVRNGQLRDWRKAATNKDSGQAGNNARWSYENGTVTIRGVGAMYDYERSELAPWYSYATQIKKIVIENGITYIGANTFSSTNLTRESENVSISTSVVSIAKDAFLNESGMVLGSEPPMSDQYEPVLKEYVALDKNDPLVQAETMVRNKAEDSFLGTKLPKNTKITWEINVDTTTIGKKSSILSVQYPDGSGEKFAIETIYVRETAYEEPAVQMKIVQDPYKTRYVKDVERFNPTGMIIKLVDKNGNKQTMQADQFEDYGVKFYTSSSCDTEITRNSTLNNGYVFVSYQGFVQSMILTVEPDGYYEMLKVQEQEWEQKKPLVDASIFIQNRLNLPEKTIYKFVKEQNSEIETNIITDEVGVQTVVIYVQYPNGTKEWVNATLTIVSKKSEVVEENKAPEVVEKPTGTEGNTQGSEVPNGNKEENKAPEVVEKPAGTEGDNQSSEVPNGNKEENKAPEVVEKPAGTEGDNQSSEVPNGNKEENKAPEVVEKPAGTEGDNQGSEVPNGNKEENKAPTSTGNGNQGGFVVPVIAVPISQELPKESIEVSKDREDTEDEKKEEIRKGDIKNKTEIAKQGEDNKNYIPSKQEKQDISQIRVTVQSSTLYMNPNNKNKKKTTTVKVVTKKRYKVTFSTTTKKIVSVNKKSGKVIAKKSGTAIIKVHFYNEQGKFVGTKTIKLKVKK